MSVSVSQLSAKLIADNWDTKSDMEPRPRCLMDEMMRLQQAGVRAMPGHKMLEIRDNSVLLENAEGSQVEVPCSKVIMCLGVRPVNTIQAKLEDLANVYLIGDAHQSGKRITDAVHEAFHIAYSLK